MGWVVAQVPVLVQVRGAGEPGELELTFIEGLIGFNADTPGFRCVDVSMTRQNV
jgi:hypothetical protein